MNLPTVRYLYLFVFFIFLGATTVFRQALDFKRVITNQPNYGAEFLSGVGLADGGSLMVGTGLVNTADPLAPSRAIGLYRFNREGDLKWRQAFPEPKLLNKNYYEPYAVHLALVDDHAYVLAVRNQLSGSTAYPMTLRKIDLLTGAELSMITLEADAPRDSLGPPVAFAMIEDAAVMIRDDYERYPRPTASTLQVFGLNDGELRASLLKERYYEENATAWPAAGLVFIAGSEPFGIDATGDTLTFPLNIAPSPESGVQPFVALGDRAVYAATSGSQGNDILVTASTDGTSMLTNQVDLPTPLAQGTAYDLSAWGQDSFAITIRGQNSPLGVFLFDANGSGGQELEGYGGLLWPHYIDGPKYAVLAEHTSAPKQRRVMARSFWSSDPLGLVTYTSLDTVALPSQLSATRPEFFDEIITTVQAGPEEILGLHQLPGQGANWIKFDRSGNPLSLPQGASLPGFVPFPKLTSLDDASGFLLHQYWSNWTPNKAYLYDRGLVLQDSVEMAEYSEDLSGSAPHPDGGVVYTIRHRDSIEVLHLTKECTIQHLATFEPSDFFSEGYYMSVEIGPQLEMALRVTPNLTRETDIKIVAFGADGELLLPTTVVHKSASPGLAWGPRGSLLIYERRGGNYQEFRPDPNGSLQLATTGRFSTDSLVISNLLYLSDDELLISYTDVETRGAPYAALARYKMSDQNFRSIRVESEESYASNVELSEDKKIQQAIRLSSGFQAVVLSQASISATSEPLLVDEQRIVARSPFTDAIYFSFKDSRPRSNTLQANLLNTQGQLVHQGVATLQANGLYQLPTPGNLAAGTYVLQVDGRASVCVKQ